MRPIRSLASIFVIFSIVSLAGRAHPNEDIIELPLQPAKCLCGVVTYENGDPARGAKVEELGQAWKGATHRIYRKRFRRTFYSHSSQGPSNGDWGFW